MTQKKDFVKTKDYKILLTSEQIQEKVTELGVKIAKDYKDEERDLVLLIILNGAVFFGADLSRELTKVNEFNGYNNYGTYIDFMGIGSYGSETESSRNPKITRETSIDLEGKNVLIIEDMIDTGYSMKKLLEILSARRPKSLKICALLSKESRREIDVPIDYCGFEIPDYWVEGYGMDTKGKHRTFPYIRFKKPQK